MVAGFPPDGFCYSTSMGGAVFPINIPIVAVSVTAVVVLGPESRSPKTPGFRAVPTVLATVGLATGTYGIIAPPHGWVTAMTAGAALLTAFRPGDDRQGNDVP